MVWVFIIISLFLCLKMLTIYWKFEFVLQQNYWSIFSTHYLNCIRLTCFYTNPLSIENHKINFCTRTFRLFQSIHICTYHVWPHFLILIFAIVPNIIVSGAFTNFCIECINCNSHLTSLNWVFLYNNNKKLSYGLWKQMN